MTDCIRIWPYYDAPADYRALHYTSDDMDYLAHVPASMRDESLVYLLGQAGPQAPLGPCCVDDYELPDGAMILVGSHA